MTARRFIGLTALTPLVAACVVDVHIHVDDREEEAHDEVTVLPVEPESPGYEFLERDDPGWLIPPRALSPRPDGSVIGDALWRPWEWEDAGLNPEPACAQITPTPFDQRPVLTNQDEVFRVMTGLYPERLRSQGIPASVDVWLCVDDTGRVRRAELDGTSGDSEVDRAAVYLANVMEFTPPERAGVPVTVWISVPISFAVR